MQEYLGVAEFLRLIGHSSEHSCSINYCMTTLYTYPIRNISCSSRFPN